MGSRFWVQGLGAGVQGFKFEVQGLGLGVLGTGILGSGFWVLGSGARVSTLYLSLGIRVDRVRQSDPVVEVPQPAARNRAKCVNHLQSSYIYLQ